MTPSLTPRETLLAVADHFDLRVEDLSGRSRVRHIAQARQVAAWVLRTRFPQLSYQAIGTLLGGRHHSTVMSAIEKIERTLATRPDAAVLRQLASLATPLATCRAPLGMTYWVSIARSAWYVQAA